MSLGGCSLYPIPDDVSFFSTEDIVRHGRCEVRDAVLSHLIQHNIILEHFTTKQIKDKIEATKTKAKNFPKTLIDEEKHLLRLIRVAIVYSYDFNIVENNKAGADAGFRLPGLTNVLDVGAVGSLDLTRQGSRVFGTQDDWGDLITKEQLCNGIAPRSGNFVHPVIGSIGIGRIVATFIDIDGQGGAKDNFVDTLTFTTLASGSANASFKLNPVPTQLRPVSATAAIGASRLDIHKLTVSLAFPQSPRGGISDVTRFDGDLNAPFTRPADWRARYNLCVADARAKETSFKMLRLEAPEVYCVRYADAFSPRVQVLVEKLPRARIQVSDPSKPLGDAAAAGQGGSIGDPPKRMRERVPSPGRIILRGRPDAPI